MYLTLYLLCLGLRCCWQFLEGSCNIVYFHSHWKRVLIAPHPQWLDVANFGSFDYSRSMTLFLTVVLICMPLMTIWNRADLGLIPGSGRPPGEGNGTPLQYSCLENPMDGGTWWAAVHGVTKSRTRLSNFTFTSHFHALEKEMATHSSVLAWRIPGTGQPGGLLSVGSHRVGHDWSDLEAAAVHGLKLNLLDFFKF